MSPSSSSTNGATSSSAIVAETTPLLGPNANGLPTPIHESQIIDATRPGDGGGSKNHEDKDKPLPKVQILVLCFARVVEPLAFFGIFPFIAEMIKNVGGLQETDVGFYSGLIESMFSLTQMCVMVPWGMAADRIGRKPVLVFSLAGVAIFSSLFGVSKAIWQMVALRCCAGLFAGTVVTIRVMFTENSTPRTQARAFSLFAFASNLGIFLGPLLGGTLADPAKNFPKLFGNDGFFHEYPYSLSTFTNGSLCACACIICAIFLKETLKKKPTSDNESDTSSPTPKTTLEILRAPGVPIVLFIYGHVMLLGLAYTAVSPVFWFTKVEHGGYEFSPLQISLFLGGIGISQAIWLLVAFPPLQHRFGTGGVLRACYIAWPIFFVSAPVCNLFLRWGGGWRTVFWVVAPTLQIGGSGVAMAFTAVQLALNDISPASQSLGTLNALALTLTAGIRTIGPAIFTSIFAVGARTQFLNGYLVWAVLVAVSLVGTLAMKWLPEKAEGKLKD